MIFGIPRWEYQSYWDYYQLIKLSGFSTVFYDEIDWGSKNTYIISPVNGEVPNPLPQRNCRIVWLNIERPTTADFHLLGRPDFDEIWVCDRQWASRIGARHFIMGSHPDHGYKSDKKYDWISCTYEVPRRTAIWYEIRDLKRGPNGWPCTPEFRAESLAASRIYAVPQQEGPPHAVTPLRFCIAAAFKLPMVYEGATDTFPFVDGTHFIHANIVHFATAVRQLLHDYKRAEQIGESLYQLLCVEHNFRRSVELMS